MEIFHFDVVLKEDDLDLIRLILENFKRIKFKDEEDFKIHVSQWIEEAVEERLEFWKTR